MRVALALYHRPVTVAFRSDDAALMRRNRWWLALGASPYAVGLSLILAALVSGVWQVAIPAFHMSLFGTLGLLWAYGANKSPVKLGGEISIGDAGVYHAGKLLVGRDELEAGFITPRPTGVTVRLQRRGRRPSLTIAVRDVEEGRALLRALGLDATQTAAELRAASDLFAWSLSKQSARRSRSTVTAPARSTSASSRAAAAPYPSGSAPSGPSAPEPTPISAPRRSLPRSCSASPRTPPLPRSSASAPRSPPPPPRPTRRGACASRLGPPPRRSSASPSSESAPTTLPMRRSPRPWRISTPRRPERSRRALE